MDLSTPHPTPSGKLKFALITTHGDWCHWENLPWGNEGVKYLIDRYLQAGIPRLCWRCTDGGTTHYWSKLRDPFHRLETDNCQAMVFMNEDLSRYSRTDYRTFDSFAAAVELGHQAGLEVYAWCQVAGEDDGFGYRSRRVKEHPEFCTVGRDGKRFAGKLGWAYPENHEYLIGLLKEVLAYKPDGVILDFLKNEGDFRDQLCDDADGRVFYGYEPPAVEEFRRKTGRDPFQIPNRDPEWVQHRASYVTAFVRKARAMQKQVAPAVRWIAQTSYAIPRSITHWVLMGRDEYRRGGPYWKVGNRVPAHEGLAGSLQDLAAWAQAEAFDAIYPMNPSAKDPAALRKTLKTYQDLIRGSAMRIEAGTYVWGATAQDVQELAAAAVESGAQEIYLVESQAFEGSKLWPQVRKIVREFGG